jgi:hypothetical protein
MWSDGLTFQADPGTHLPASISSNLEDTEPLFHSPPWAGERSCPVGLNLTA